MARGKYTHAIQAITAFTQGVMGNNIVTAIANGSAPYLANEVKNQIQGNSVESDIQRMIAHGITECRPCIGKRRECLSASFWRNDRGNSGYFIALTLWQNPRRTHRN
ncbi:hypothetical protein [Proteus terrae]|uniref:hypothetical protein n=1 Tax=Proteus terrae TaxID=1574161 RepID=UPI0013E013F8|nr:hypothetical protein [Proteus terrae]QIF97772.1 hypothetical protein GTH25_06790 [Proteus terrae subsp. cibarius]